MTNVRVFSNFENANAILNGQEDCCNEFVEAFVNLHKEPIDNNYMYDWLLRSLIDVVKINHSVLYVACGTAGYTRLFKNIKRFVGVDFSKKMIAAARELNNNQQIKYDFFNTTFEQYTSQELFDVIYLGPYGHNVPYTLEVIHKAKRYLKDGGMLFCTLPDPGFIGIYSRLKAFVKHVIKCGNFSYDPVTSFENMIKKTGLETWCKLRMKTSLGHCYCYILKDNKV